MKRGGTVHYEKEENCDEKKKYAKEEENLEIKRRQNLIKQGMIVQRNSTEKKRKTAVAAKRHNKIICTGD